MTVRVGVYPGTFDPIHNGHIDIIRRATRMLDKLVVAVAANAGKGPLFTLEERTRLVEREVSLLMAGNRTNGCRVVVKPFSNLLMHFVKDEGGQFIIRGLRAVSDFEYEFQMGANNARLNPDVETMFLMAAETTQFISSRFVKEIGVLGGDVSSFVSRHVHEALLAKFQEAGPAG
ncbi:MAG: pantetheine-phosphate adenylyltransferase [Geminicoccaceae bacterium]|nr:MAG: pantetheine-phosphate adenylyltransferase [Geminicoccaceae bacterium]